MNSTEIIWSKNLPTNICGKSVTLDATGNVIFCGHLGQYAILSKFDTDGTNIWTNTFSGTLDSSIQDITIDSNSNIYITGSYDGTLSVESLTISSTGHHDVFIAKLNVMGSIQWLKSGGSNGTSRDVGYGIALDSNNNIAVVGSINGNANFDGLTLNSLGNSDGFIAQYDNSGNIQFLKSLGGGGNDLINGVGFDTNNNMYITGWFMNSATFDTKSVTALGESDIFIAKYNNLGKISWVKTVGGTNVDSAESIFVSPNGSTFITGFFYGTVSFNGVVKTSVGGDSYLIRVDN